MRVLIAVTGCIAAYKAVDVASALKKNDYEVHAMMTEKAKDYCPINALKVQANVFWEFDPAKPQHIYATEEIDIFAVVPATANTIAKITMGLADNLVTDSALALKDETRRIIFPAMNTRMFNNIATQENLDTLRKRGWTVICPAIGQLACGTEGEGKLPSTREIVNEILKLHSHTLENVGEQK